MSRILKYFIVFVGILSFVGLALAQSEDLSKVLKGASRYLKGGGEGISSSIGRDRYQYSVRPGEFIEDTFIVYNKNAFNAIFNIEPGAAIMGSDNRAVSVSLSSVGPDHIARNTKVNPAKFTMPPNSQKNVKFSIKVPRGASGTQYVEFNVQSSLTEKKLKQLKQKELVHVSELGFSPVVRVVVAVNIGEGGGSGPAGGEGFDIVSANVSPSPLSGSVTVKSQQGTDLAVTVAAVVLDSEGKVAARLRPSGRIFIRPNEQKTITAESTEKQLGSGKYKVRFQVVSDKGNTKTIEKPLVIK